MSMSLPAVLQPAPRGLRVDASSSHGTKARKIGVAAPARLLSIVLVSFLALGRPLPAHPVAGAPGHEAVGDTGIVGLQRVVTLMTRHHAGGVVAGRRDIYRVLPGLAVRPRTWQT